jgi:hypothetical protein
MSSCLVVAGREGVKDETQSLSKISTIFGNANGLFIPGSMDYPPDRLHTGSGTEGDVRNPLEHNPLAHRSKRACATHYERFGEFA